MTDRTNPYAKGIMGETAALRYLTGLGMSPLCRRYRAGRGEIDWILLDGEILVFVEVKSREKNGTAAAAQAVTRDKQRRLSEAACYYVCEHPEHAQRIMRFDVVTVTREGIGHFPNAFEILLPRSKTE